MEEQYVSKDVAIMLSFLGFNDPCDFVYLKDNDKLINGDLISTEEFDNVYLAPTIEQLNNWLQNES